MFVAVYSHPLASEDLSEEDQQLKSELDMLVERLMVCLDPVRLKNDP